MSDKEPRRRKKRKDLQSARKDDIHSEDQIFLSTKTDAKDSDQEAEEEIVVPSHQPSVFAKFVFVLLFSSIIVSMSFIFISLRGSDRGEVDILDDHHVEEADVFHDDHSEADHDEHEHEESETWSSEASFQDNMEALLPGIGSILKFKDEHIKEPKSVAVEEQEDDVSEKSEDTELTVEQLSKLSDMTSDYDDSTVQNDIVEEESEVLGQVVEEIISSEVRPETASEIFTTEEEQRIKSIPHTSEDVSPKEELGQLYEEDEEDIETTSQNIIDQSEFSTYPPQTIPTTESVAETVQNVDDSLLPDIEAFYEEESQSLNEEISFDVENDFSEIKNEEERLSFYEKADITNEVDYEIRDQLDELDAVLEKSPDRALRKSEELLQLHKGSPRLHHINAQALDKLAETLRSNKHLEDAIASYQKVMSLKGVPDELYLLAGKRAADRMRFRGFMGKSLKLLLEMAQKYPQNVELQNLLAVGYLMIGQNKEAKRVLYEILKLAPDSGFAKVHLGFILKTDDSNYQEAVKLLSEGIASRATGVIDGRFYFHLGDALHRMGKQDEALKVYNEAVVEGLFLSAYQRSLYNVKGLTGKPWWHPQSTIYAPYFKLLEKNWLSIRDEALSLTNERNSGFLPESEGLQEKGDWKQFELFARGRKIEKNCLKAPKTCALILQMPDAANCKRGQVKFSIMQPSTHVWAHTGPTNCRLRSHLGLVIPDGASIRVANETRLWEEGKVIVFDDSFEHEVWHNGNESRLILIVDFWHPELTAYQKKTLTPI